MSAESSAASNTRRVLVAITGASGSIYGVRLLELMRPLPDVETHLILSKAGRVTLAAECDRSAGEVEALADTVHAPGNIAAPPASGSFRVHAMLIAPCSIRTASNIASGNTGDLISRAADVMLKERRLLIVGIRETPRFLFQAHGSKRHSESDVYEDARSGWGGDRCCCPVGGVTNWCPNWCRS
jgi:4-hydroxy-3-polyprenylbenzoate decarboxylase